MPSSRRRAVANHIKQHIGTRFNRFGSFGLPSVRYNSRSAKGGPEIRSPGPPCCGELVAPIAAPSGYSDALIVPGTAAFVVPLVRRWGISPVLGYLGAGAILGPLGLGSFGKSIPMSACSPSATRKMWRALPHWEWRFCCSRSASNCRLPDCRPCAGWCLVSGVRKYC